MNHRVLIADDHSLYREGLVGIIAKWEGFEVVGTAFNGREAVELCHRLSPDIALLDVRMPDMNGIDATRFIVQDSPKIAVVLISMYLNEEDLFSAIVNGARGYLLKDIHIKQLKNSLEVVLKGDCILSPEATTLCFKTIHAQQFSGHSTDPALRKMKASLTNRERELLHLVALGKSNREIGARLYLGESTIKKQLSNLLMKLNMENRTQAAIFALKAGLVD